MFCVATQDVTERIVQEEKKISPKLTTNARSVKTSPVDSSPLDGALLAAAFANEGREGGSRENRWIIRNNTGLNLEPGVWRGYFLGKPVTWSLWRFWIYSLRPGKFYILHYDGILACFCEVVHAVMSLGGYE